MVGFHGWPIWMAALLFSTERESTFCAHPEPSAPHQQSSLPALRPSALRRQGFSHVQRFHVDFRNLAIRGDLQFILQHEAFGSLSLENKQQDGQSFTSWCFRCVGGHGLFAMRDQAAARQLCFLLIRTSRLLKSSDWMRSGSPAVNLQGPSALSGLVAEGAGLCVLS